MKKILFTIIVSFSLNSRAQDLENFKKIFLNEVKLSSIEHIRNRNNFDQSNLSADVIDSILTTLQSGLLIRDVELPTNNKKLHYIGYLNPADTIDFQRPAFDSVMKMINRGLEIFNYDGVWILVPDKSGKNLLNVFFAARALEILKNKYPEAYSYLIKPDQVKLGYEKTDPEAKNTINKFVPIISFDKSPTKIAGSLWNMQFAPEPNRQYKNMKVYENTLNGLVSINYETERPKEIYKKSDELENYWLYLREGLIESLVHEFTHLYIANFKYFDTKAGAIYNKRYDALDKSFSSDVEEPIVINTVETYFLKKGGLSKDLTDFNINVKYQGMKSKLTDMNNPVNQARFEMLRNLSPIRSEEFDKVYRLHMLEVNEPSD